VRGGGGARRQLAVTYQGEVMEKCAPLAAQLGGIDVSADVTDSAARCTVRDDRRGWRRLDFAVHAIAYADRRSSRADISTPAANFRSR
jgi:enoyl-[acyl-carrier-protein] reductase (NADH)